MDSPRIRFHRQNRVHTRLCSKDRTQRHTRRNRWHFGWGWYHYPRTVPHVHKHPQAGYQNGVLCRFWVLAGCALEERRKPSGQRCAYACRCPEGVAAPLGCVICLQLGDVAVFSLCAQYFLNVRGGVVSLLSERSARSPTSPGRVSERQVLPLLGLGRVPPKNAESLRNSDALMHVAVPRRRGPAGLRDLFATW